MVRSVCKPALPALLVVAIDITGTTGIIDTAETGSVTNFCVSLWLKKLKYDF
ncbi:MAG TPA: hypothetical protein VJ875_22070 [Pyrinomonadaceae bacterium]|nr:hypothetical protein [Pyrinomonadaceae bacterium]